jgi:acyl-CoA synthetase (AMP-forming)/AMP-acid ligase II
MFDESGRRGDLELGTIPRLVRIAAERHGQRHAIEDGETTLTFAKLASSVRRATRALMACGIERGDRVAIWGPNSWEWIVAALATHEAGCVLVPLNTRYKGGEAAYVLAKSGARAIFSVAGFLGNDYLALLRESGEALPNLRTRVVMRGDASSGSLGWEAFLASGEAVSERDAAARAESVEPGDLCDLLFTSGTTGRPKGVMCTHAQTLRAFREWADIVGLRADDRYLVVPPFFHSFGYKAGWLACLIMGATVVPQPMFDVDQVLERVARERITVLPGPPTLYQSILTSPRRHEHDLSSLRLAVTGAAVIPVELVHAMRRDLRFETVITAYGLTEATGVTTMCRRDDDAETIATTSGRAIPGVEVRVADVQRREVPRGAPGEVLVRGYTVTRGYFDDADETAAAIDAEGWLRTGDIGVMDARGNLKITDRQKDMFIVGGFNAYPAEIERELLLHEAIAQAAVIGIPDERLGEVGMAFVVLRPGASLAPNDLIAWSRDRMANYKAPRRVEIVDKLPLNATGKVLKYELRARVRG